MMKKAHDTWEKADALALFFAKTTAFYPIKKFLIVTAFALATPAVAADCPDKVIAAADHLGLNRVESFGATHPTYYLPASLDGSGLLVIDCIEAALWQSLANPLTMLRA